MTLESCRARSITQMASLLLLKGLGCSSADATSVVRHPYPTSNHPSSSKKKKKKSTSTASIVTSSSGKGKSSSSRFLLNSSRLLQSDAPPPSFADIHVHEELEKEGMVRRTSCAREEEEEEEGRDDVVVVHLRVSLHCKGCAGKVKKQISKMEGVTSFHIDIATKKVTVVGHITPLAVLNTVSKVKPANFWPSQPRA